MTKQLPDGSQVGVTSNGVPVLVVWTFFDETAAMWPRGLYHTPDTEAVPGPIDSVGVCLKGYGADGLGEIDLSLARHDGSTGVLYHASEGSLTLGGGAQTAIDPLSGQVVAGVAIDRPGSSTWYLRNLSTGATLYQFPNDPQGATLIPMAVRFDAAGDLFVATYDYQDGRTSIFRFAPGDPVTFDPSGPANLVTGVVVLKSFCFEGADMAVSGDGTVVYAPCALVQPGSSDEILRVVPGPGGPRSEVTHLPDLHYSEGTQWHLAGRCNGGVLAAGSCWASECNSTVSVFDLDDGSSVATLDGVGLLGGFSSDGYDDFFVEGVIWHGGGWHLGLRRLTVADLPSGFYGTPPAGVAATTMRASALFSTPADAATIPPEWLVKRREPLRPELMRARQVLGVLPNQRVAASAPGQRSSASQNPGATPSLARVAGLTPLGLPPGLYCVRKSGYLVLLLTRDTAEPKTEEVAIPGNSRVSTTVLFGQAPWLALGWRDPNGSLVPVKAAWELVPDSEHVINGAPKTLFPERPEVIFAESGLPLLGPSVQFQTVHLGWFDLKVTPSDATYGGPVTIDVNVDVPAGLAGANHNLDLDQKIIYAANQFGFPPQVVKSQVDIESAHSWDPYAFRYEPRTVDKGLLWPKGLGWWTNPLDEFIDYRLPRSIGVLLTDDDVKPRDTHYSNIAGFDWTVIPPTWPYGCGSWTEADDNVLMWNIVEANDGWPRCSYSWMQYNDLNGNDACDDLDTHVGPCRRSNWFNIKAAGWLTYFRYGNRFYCSPDPTSIDCTDWNSDAQWFLNGDGQTYVGQTPLASSYGLMQILYTTAVQTMRWNEGSGRAPERHPAALFDVSTNLDVGVGYDAQQVRLSVIRGQSSAAFTCLDDYKFALAWGIGAYNNGNIRYPRLAYGQAVVGGAVNYKPF